MDIELVRTERDLRTSDYWSLCAITLLYWDHILTLPIEIKYLWKRPRFISSYLFFIHRYFSAFANIVVIFSLFSSRTFLESPSCKPLEQVREGVLVVAQVIVLLIMTLRIYALYGCSKRLLRILLGVLVILLSAAAFATFYDPGGEELEPVRCHTQRDFQRSIQTAGAWEVLFVYDTLIFLLACYKAYQTRKEFEMFKARLPLTNIVIRDGALYFWAMSMANLANILTFYVSFTEMRIRILTFYSDAYPQPFMRGGLASMASSISVTLVSRLMLNLHEITDTGAMYQFTTHQIETRLQFYERSILADSDNIDS
ncbi:hypothetical protein Moror_14478 [Moniliophthora roreri MCA 2997]|uniref:DUF6533 domain-containing protein n=1 Tax=Moniliophthora roreri (strain MCA 2997) TaxID=1381753 RepID=V2WKR7_MONRO|nr:hypothetical protein Moror_14478 [Moniliophthora roreri MCA 2997]